MPTRHASTPRTHHGAHTNEQGARHGSLLIIGGHEDKCDERLLLRTIAERTGDAGLVVCTAASDQPDAAWADYEPAFRDLGVADLRHLHVDVREQARDPSVHQTLDGAATVFFTGGDQLKLTSQLGDTPVYEKTREIFERGGCIAGTSAGASVMCETMMVTGEQSASPRVNDTLRMAAGFGFLQGALVDQHFAERGRIGRLIGAVAQNPRILGIGIDEDTGILVEGAAFQVIGSGGVYVIDGREVHRSNVVEDASDCTLSVFGMRLHLLSVGDAFELETRAPRPGTAREAVMSGRR